MSVLRCHSVARRLAVAVTLLTASMCLAAETVNSEQAAPIYITQMDACQPGASLSVKMEQGKWQTIPYKAEGVAGTMVGALSFIHAPDLTLPLNVSGWHRVYVGFWNPQFDWDGDPTVKVRLSDEPAFRLIFDRHTYTHSETYLREVFLTAADLTGQGLVIGKSNGLLGRKAYIAYLKLVPMSTAEVEAIVKDRADPTTRNLVSVIDGMTYFHYNEFRTPDDLLALVEPYRHSDVAKVLWAVTYGLRTNYPTKVEGATNIEAWSRGPLAGSGDGTNYIRGEKQTYDTLTALRAEGIVPQQVAAKHAHAMGLRFDLMFRLGILGPVPGGGDTARFVSRHPEYRQVLRDGTVIHKASYAFPEVRQVVLDLIREATTDIDADGINLCFVRGPHLLHYEKPILKAFQAKHGEDALKVDPNDPRLLAVRAEIMTQFLRDARQVLDAVGEKKGKRLDLSVWVWPTGQNVWMGTTPLAEGLDLKAWIQEGLLDSAIFQEGVDEECLRLCEQHDCDYTLFTGYRGDKAMSPESVTQAYEAGVSHFAYWDMDCVQFWPENWAWVRRIGHRAEMAAWDREAHKVRSIRLHTIDGVDVLNGLAGAVFSGG
jgi:hypothetical protein